MKKILYLFFLPLFFWGCSSSIDTANLSSQERLDYAMKLYDDEVYDQAISEFQSILLQFPGSSVIDKAQFYLAQSRFNRGEYLLAAYEFSKLISNMPASEFLAMSQYMLAECYYQLSPSFPLDQKYTKKSIEEFQAFIDFFPTNEKAEEAEKKIAELNEKLAEKTFNTAVIYQKMEYFTAAILYFDIVIGTFHDTKYAPLAQYNKIKLLIDRKKNQEAVKEIDKFLEKYPDNSAAKELISIKNSIESKLSAVR